MKKIGFLGLGAVIAAGAFSLLSGGEPAPKQVGYFKSDGGNRVMAYQARTELSERQAREVLAGVMHTPGRLTFAVIYPKGATHPGHRLTGAANYAAAAEMLDTAPYDGWSWATLVDISGARKLEVK